MSAARTRALGALALSGALAAVLQHTRESDAYVLLTEPTAATGYGAVLMLGPVSRVSCGRAKRVVAISFAGDVENSVVISRETLRRLQD